MPTPLNQKPATAAWIVRERKHLQLKPRDIVERLAAQGLTVSEATVKVWESNADRRPAPENIAGLERIFGSAAPTTETPSSDLAAAISGLVAELRADREEHRQLTEMRLRSLELAVERLSRQAIEAGSAPPLPRDAKR